MHHYLAFLLLAATPALAQRPDFSGTWTSSPAGGATVATAGDAAFRRGDMESGWSSTITLAQGADSLIVSYVFFVAYDLQPPVRLAFAMNGAESRNAVILSHTTEVRRSRLTWNGQSLVITTQHPAPPGVSPSAAEVRQTLTLESPTSLVLETARAGNVIRTVYTKKT